MPRSNPRATEVITSIRAALSRIPDAGSVTISRAEFELIANAVSKAPRRPVASEAQASLPLDMPRPVFTPPRAVFDTGPLPGHLDPEQLRALLATPKTAKTIARVVKKSAATVKRALRLLPDVELIGTRTRKNKPGHRPNVYGLIH